MRLNAASEARKASFFFLAFALFATGLVGCDEGISSSATPGLVLNPDVFRFGKQEIGSSADRTVQLENIGNGELIIANIRFEVDNSLEEFELFWKTEANGQEFVGITSTGDDQFPYPVTIPGQSSLYLVLSYTARNEEPIPGRVILETNLPAEEATVEIPVILAEGSPEINVTPNTWDFDRVPAGETAEKEIQVTNVGQLDLEISRVLLNGSQDFKPLITVDGSQRDPRQVGSPIETLSPGDSMDIVVRYAPPIEGPDAAELTIFSNDPNRPEVVVSLAANGATPCLKVNPPALEFRTSLVNRTDSRPMSMESCGGAPIEITRVYLSQDSDPAFEVVEDSVPMLPAIMPAYAAEDRQNGLPPPSRSFEVAFTPREQRIHNGTLIIESNDPVNPRREVPLLGRGVTNACPQARAETDEFYVVPLDVVVLNGEPSIDQDGPDNRPVQYEWVITSRPDGSVSQPHESFYDPAQPANGGLDDDVNTPNSVFFVDLAGTYTAELRVRDNLGLDSIACENPAVVTIVAKPEEAIHVQLVWRTPADDDETDLQGTDLDLHLLHPNAENWFSRPYDCHYAEPTPDWGQLDNSADDPSLDIDDINGAGPENINLDNPENTDALGAPYLVGVHYYNSRDRRTGFEYGPSFATVRIFIEGQLTWDFTDDGNPGEREMEAADHFWDTAQISWPSGDVVTRNRYYSQRP